MAQVVLEARQLTKAYNGTVVVDRLDLKIEEGEIFGFLGPNGAGKTTTILMLLGLTEPTSGEAFIYGHNCTKEALKVKRVTGYLPENVGFYEDMTARENLKYVARLNSIPERQASIKIEELLKIVGLTDVADREVGKFSRGMRQRLGIANVLVKEPSLVILDEPTTGIDPEGVNQILGLIVSMARERGMAVLLCSHLLYQVQKICDRVGIIVDGKFVVEGSMQQMGQKMASESKFSLEVRVNQLNDSLVESIKSVPGVSNVERFGDTMTVKSEEDVTDRISKAVVDAGSLPLMIRAQDYTLEEIYMKYFRGE
jgi:ABC-2 type transport system ATP-binding protein